MVKDDDVQIFDIGRVSFVLRVVYWEEISGCKIILKAFYEETRQQIEECIDDIL